VKTSKRFGEGLPLHLAARHVALLAPPPRAARSSSSHGEDEQSPDVLRAGARCSLLFFCPLSLPAPAHPTRTHAPAVCPLHRHLGGRRHVRSALQGSWLCVPFPYFTHTLCVATPAGGAKGWVPAAPCLQTTKSTRIEAAAAHARSRTATHLSVVRSRGRSTVLLRVRSGTAPSSALGPQLSDSLPAPPCASGAAHTCSTDCCYACFWCASPTSAAIPHVRAQQRSDTLDT
jgi:hypothetical protein